MAKIEVDESMFECPVCMVEIDDTCKMLRCQHIFCEECLEKLYEVNQNPQCPICRKRITVSIERLQKPLLLLNLLEKAKASQEERVCEKDDLTVAIEQSIEDQYKKQEIDSSFIELENVQLQIGLSKSEDQAIFEAEKESLLSARDEDVTTAINLSIQEYNERESRLSFQEEFDLQTALLKSERDALMETEKKLAAMMKSSHQTDSDFKSVIDHQTECNMNPVVILEANTCTDAQNLCNSTTDLAESNVIVSYAKDVAEISTDNNMTDFRVELSEVVIGNVIDKEKANLSVKKINIPDLTNYLRIKHRKPILDTIIIETMDEKKLNSLKKAELSWYLEVMDDYVSSVENYRREQMNVIVENCARNNENIEHVLLLKNWNSCSSENAIFRGTREDHDLAFALELSRQIYIEKNEEELLEITLKKSEILDPIDELYSQLLNIKEKLEFVMAIIASEE